MLIVNYAFTRFIMQWSDSSLVISTRKYGENAAIIGLLSEHHGLCYGLVRGNNSAKSRGIYQQGNLIFATWKARLAEHLGSITGELLESSALIMLGDKGRLSALASICSLIPHCLPENEPAPLLFSSLYHVIAVLKTDQHWYSDYLKFELTLLNLLGFGLDLSECAATGSTENLCYISPKTGRAVSAEAGAPYKDKLFLLPDFLKNAIFTDKIGVISAAELKQGLRVTGYFLDKWNFHPRNINFPMARIQLEEQLSGILAHN
jgi:DNA repair protein RecO (recombination protein O)